MLGVPRRCRLVGPGHAQNGCFVEGLAHDLQAHGQALGGVAARHGYGGQADDVEGHGVAQAERHVFLIGRGDGCRDRAGLAGVG